MIPVFATKTQSYGPVPGDFPPTVEALRGPVRPITVRAGDVFLGLDLATDVLPRHEKQIRAWKRQGVGIHLVVYDLLPISGPTWFRLRTQLRFRRWLGVLARQADGAVCISADVRGKLGDWLRRTSPRRAKGIRLSTIRQGGDIRTTAPTVGSK